MSEDKSTLFPHRDIGNTEELARVSSHDHAGSMSFLTAGDASVEGTMRQRAAGGAVPGSRLTMRHMGAGRE